jgi:hypothetical protein
MFGRNTHLAAADTVVYIGTSDRYEIGAYGLDGRLRRSIRVLRPLVSVTEDDIARAESTRMANLESEAQRAMWRGFFDNMQFPPTFPAFRDLVVDDHGNLWVAHYSTVPGPRIWSAFDPRGQLLGEIAMAAGFFASEVSSSQVLGYTIDDLGVHRVAAYRILRPGEAPPKVDEPVRTVAESDSHSSAYRSCGMPG